MSNHVLTGLAPEAFNVVMQVFQKLIRPDSIPNEARTLHATIISILASKLESCFLTLREWYPRRSSIPALIEATDSISKITFSAGSTTAEPQWGNSSTGSDCSSSLRVAIRDLCNWSSPANPMPLTPIPSYTSRLLQGMVMSYGPMPTLHIILEEIKGDMATQLGPVALDVAVSLVLAPGTRDSANAFPTDWSRCPPPNITQSNTCFMKNLRDALEVEFSRAERVYAKDIALAETIVRLHRRVAAFLVNMTSTVLAAPAISLTGDVDIANAVDDATASMVAAAAAGQVPVIETQVLPDGLTQHVDLSAGSAAAGPLDLGMGLKVDVDVAAAAAAAVAVASAGPPSAAPIDMTTMANMADMSGLVGLDLGAGLDMDHIGDMGDLAMGGADDDDAWGLDLSNM